MTDLLLHPRTRNQIDTLLAHIPSGLLITGVTGSGKETLAYYMAARILGLRQEKLVTYGYFQVVSPSTTGNIGIDEIRALQQFLKLKVPDYSGHPGIKRVIIINQANTMRSEAQNALLKTLEEPPLDTGIILTAESEETLLPTITSRVSTLAVLPVSFEQARSHYQNSGVKPTELAKQYALSQGQAGLLNSLLGNESHPLVDQVTLAKQILGDPAGKRLLRTDEIAKDKPAVRLLLDALQRISHAALAASSQSGKVQSVKQWHGRQAAVLESIEQFGHNANTKLLLDNLFLML